MEAIRFEDGLSTLVRQDTWGILDHLALAELAGVSDRVHNWLRARLDDEPGKKVRAGGFGAKSFDEIGSLWEVLRQGGPLEILNSVWAAVPDRQDQSKLSLAFDGIVEPLVLLQRGPVIRALHDELAERLDASSVERAAIALGACGEWDDALGILEQAHRDGANPHINLVTEDSLWQHAYLQGEVDTVLPRLAAIPFHRERAHAAEGRAWQLVAYQLRAGRTDIHVPVISNADQPFGYQKAVAMAIAALEEAPTPAQAVAELHGVLSSPQTTTFQFPDRGLALQWTPDDLATARVRVAARRRDYAKLSTLAEASSSSPSPLSAVIIEALLEEGDWRGAAEFAGRYDPRDKPVIKGFDDIRMHEYSLLQLVLAAQAARGGDDAAARAHLAEHVAALRSIEEADQDEWDDGEMAGAGDTDAMPPALGAATILAGVAEGVVPRSFLPMLLSVFHNAF